MSLPRPGTAVLQQIPTPHVIIFIHIANLSFYANINLLHAEQSTTLHALSYSALYRLQLRAEFDPSARSGE